MKDIRRLRGMNDWVSILLAGGESRRMGRSKARLYVEGKMVIRHLVDLVKPFSMQIIIVSNAQDEPLFQRLFEKENNVSVVKDDDRFKGEGPLAGMYTGMNTFPAQWYFIGACDMVNLNKDYLQGLHLLGTSSVGFDAFVPVNEQQKIHPLAGLYRNQSQVIHSLLVHGRRRVTDLLQQINTYYIEEQDWKKWTDADDPFFNMNHPHDYQDWIKRRENHHG
jgi:molybdopterin-guanine dinucleotide biosynthesis protein A